MDGVTRGLFTTLLNTSSKATSEFFEQQVQSKHEKILPHLTPNYAKPLSASMETSVSQVVSQVLFFVVFRANRKSCAIYNKKGVGSTGTHHVRDTLKYLIHRKLHLLTVALTNLLAQEEVGQL